MKRQRFFALFFAVLFLLTSSSLAIAFIVANMESKNNSGSSTSNTSAKTSPLIGTKLSGFTPVSNVAAVQISDLKVGSGATLKAGQTITFDYTGAVASTGVIFGSSIGTGQPLTEALKTGSLISGLVQGLPGMKVGGTRRVLIPSSLGYGSTAQTGIPANSDLVFDITLNSIKS